MPVSGTLNAGICTTTSGSPSGHFGAGFAASGKRVLAFTARRTALDPVDDHLHLRVRQAHVVGPDRAVAVRMVRRHALGPQHFADHRREAFDDVVAVHRERTEAALRVAARRTFRRAPARSASRSRSSRTRSTCWRSGKSTGVPFTAASATGTGLPSSTAFERRGQRRFLVLLLRERIVDRTVIRDRPGLGLDQEDFRRRRDAQRATDQLQLVLQHRQVGRARRADELAARRIQRRIEHQELHVLALECVADFGERFGGPRGDGVAVCRRHQDDGRAGRVVIELVAHAALVGQHEVVDLRPDERGVRVGARGAPQNTQDCGRQAGCSPSTLRANH